MINGRKGILASWLLAYCVITVALVGVASSQAIAQEMGMPAAGPGGFAWNPGAVPPGGDPNGVNYPQQGQSAPWGNCEPCNSPCEPLWTATADALIMHRSTSGSQPLLNMVLLPIALENASDMEYPYTAGPRVNLIRRGLWGYELEGGFFGLFGGKATANFPDGSFPLGYANLVMDNDSYAETPVSQVAFSETSTLYNAEINLRQPCNDWMTLLAGFRWVQFDETFQSQGVFYYDDTDFTHTIKTHNQMFGFQVGTDMSFFRESIAAYQYGIPGRIFVNGFIKTGIYYNSASQRSDLLNPDGVGEYITHAGDSHPTLLSEAGLTLVYQLNSQFSMHAGYQVMYLDGVALAARQIPRTDLITDESTVDTSSSVLYHGIVAGMEFTY